MLLGFFLIAMMRWSIAYPGQPIPVIGYLLHTIMGDMASPVLDPQTKELIGYAISNDLYNKLRGHARHHHGVPCRGATGVRRLWKLCRAASDWSARHGLPRLNMASYHLFLLGGLVMFASFFILGACSGRLDLLASGNFHSDGWSVLLAGGHGDHHHFLSPGGGELHCYHHSAACPGMTWMRMPFFCWAVRDGLLLLLAFSSLEVGALLQLMDNVAGTSFYLPTGLAVSTLSDVSGGGSPLLYQHLFWFLGHPEVCADPPAMGVVSEIIANNTRKPIWGYKSLVYSVLVLGFLSFIVWAHHMYLRHGHQDLHVFPDNHHDHLDSFSDHLSCLFISLWGGEFVSTRQCSLPWHSCPCSGSVV